MGKLDNKVAVVFGAARSLLVDADGHVSGALQGLNQRLTTSMRFARL